MDLRKTYWDGVDWIQGEKFIGLADFAFSPPQRAHEDYDLLNNTLNIEKAQTKTPCVIYTHTMYVKQLFDIIDKLNHKFIVITHNSDENITFSPPNNVIRWFSQNVAIRHPAIEPLPLGIENNIYNNTKRKKMEMLFCLKTPRRYINMVYMNYNINTNTSSRQIPHIYFKDKPWVTTCMRKNGIDFSDYIQNIRNHKFVICPEGHGIDTYRFWECLYMDSIPIIKKSILSDLLYSYFPCVICDSWDEITEERLVTEFDEIKNIKSYYGGNKNMLDFNYWANKINKTKNEVFLHKS